MGMMHEKLPGASELVGLSQAKHLAQGWRLATEIILLPKGRKQRTANPQKRVMETVEAEVVTSVGPAYLVSWPRMSPTLPWSTTSRYLKLLHRRYPQSKESIDTESSAEREIICASGSVTWQEKGFGMSLGAHRSCRLDTPRHW